jgi:hypothetical protein
VGFELMIRFTQEVGDDAVRSHSRRDGFFAGAVLGLMMELLATRRALFLTGEAPTVPEPLTETSEVEMSV